MSPRTGITRTFTISFPQDLADQVERLAARESRTTSELFREAFRLYRAERIRTSLNGQLAQAREKSQGQYSPDDVVRLIAEDRAQRAASRKRERAN
jgi:metal-responsive CopG/Arc/MetJ family transcriptional regulator